MVVGGGGDDDDDDDDDDNDDDDDDDDDVNDNNTPVEASPGARPGLTSTMSSPASCPVAETMR